MATASKQLSISVKVVDFISAPLTSMEKALHKFANSGSAAVSGLAKALTSLKGLLIEVALVMVAREGVEWIKSVAERTFQIQRLADGTGDLVENLSELQAAFRHSGVEEGGFEAILRKLVAAQGDAIEGNDGLRLAFARLGISVEFLRTHGPSAIFEQMTKGLEQFAKGGEQSAIVTDILGKQALKLLPILTQGLDKFQEAVRAQRALGATVTDEESAISKALTQAFEAIHVATDNVGRALIVAFGPRATVLLEKLAHALVDNKELVVKFAEAVGVGISKAVTIAIDALIGLVEFIELIPGLHLVPQDPVLAAEEARLRKHAEQLSEEFAKAFKENDAGKQGLILGDISKDRARLDEIGLQLNSSLADIMQRARKQVQQDLDAMLSETGHKTASVDEAAAKVGLPPIATWEEYARAMSEALGKTTPSSPTGTSVFKPIIDGSEKATRSVTGFVAGWEKGIESLEKKLTDFGFTVGSTFANLAEQSIDRLSSSMADVITGAKSAKEAFKDFAKGFLNDLAKMISQILVLGTIKTIFGLESGGVVPAGAGAPTPGFADGGVARFARGGIARSPTLLFGEGRTAEAFVPLPDNRSIPVTFTGGGQGGGGAQAVNITINAMDSRDVHRMLVEQQGTLRQIFTNQVERQNQMRHVIQRAAG